jgi:hypothetical protein
MSTPPSFNGPWATNLTSLTASLTKIPPQYKPAFNAYSDTALKAICSPSHLHIWETDSDIPSLLQLAQVIVKLKDMQIYMPSKSGLGKSVPAGMLILVEKKNSGKEARDDFGRVCDLVKYLTGESGSAHLNGGVMSYGGIKVVKGVDNSLTPDATGTYTSAALTEVKKVVERLNKTIPRILASEFYTASTAKIVWHHGPVIHMLLHYITSTTSSIRGKFAAITINSAFNLSAKGMTVSAAGKLNRKAEFERLDGYCKKLDIFAVLADTGAQGIEFKHLAVYMMYHGYHINTLLPRSVTRPHLQTGIDQLVRYAFQLRGAVEKTYGVDVVKHVQKKLSFQTTKGWARECVDPASYTKEKCRAANNDDEIHEAVLLADAPYAQLTAGIPAFSRLTFGPAASLITDHYLCAPIGIDLSSMRIRASAPSSFRLWVPKPDQQHDVTSRIQGMMIGVTTMVWQNKVNTEMTVEEKEMWEEAMKAIEWALVGCKGKMPKGVEEKVEYVERNLKTGTFACAVKKLKIEDGHGWTS